MKTIQDYIDELKQCRQEIAIYQDNNNNDDITINKVDNALSFLGVFQKVLKSNNNLQLPEMGIGDYDIYFHWDSDEKGLYLSSSMADKDFLSFNFCNLNKPAENIGTHWNIRNTEELNKFLAIIQKY